MPSDRDETTETCPVRVNGKPHYGRTEIEISYPIAQDTTATGPYYVYVESFVVVDGSPYYCGNINRR